MEVTPKAFELEKICTVSPLTVLAELLNETFPVIVTPSSIRSPDGPFPESETVTPPWIASFPPLALFAGGPKRLTWWFPDPASVTLTDPLTVRLPPPPEAGLKLPNTLN